MNILIYIPQLDQSWGGVRQYAVGLIKELASANDNNSFIVYHNQDDLEIVSLIQNNKGLELVSDSSVEYIPQTHPSITKRSINFLRSRLNLPVKQVEHKTHIELLCIKYKIDIIHCPYQFIPQVSNVKLITTLHDVQELHFPEFFTPEDRASRATRWLDYLKRADKVIVSYKHVKEDLIKYFFVSPQKIEVILLNMGKLWLGRFSDSDIIALDNYHLPDKFIFYPANTWKHKNHTRLIEAIAYLRDVRNVYVNIVCSGHTTEHYHNEIEKLIIGLNLINQIKFIGIVNEAELYSLYKTAEGVVVPTLYEAGSFPLVESILLNVPVVCSDVTSLPETINNPVCLFSPFSIESMALKIEEMWLSDDFRRETIKNNIYSSHLLTETKALEKLLETYNSFGL